jgi:Xaa-Pro aminopeptidase
MTEQEIRISKLRQEMKAAGADACLIISNVNLYYFFGQIVMGYLYIPIEKEPVLFVKRPVGLESDQAIYVHKPEQIPGLMAERGLTLPQRIMFEDGTLTYSEHVRYETIFSPATIINGTPAIRKIRSVKTPAELDLFRLSGNIHAEVCSRIPGLYRRGMTDQEFSIEIEREFRLAGSLGVFRGFGQSMEIFMGSILAGDNACEPSPYDFALGGKGLHPSIPVGASNHVLEEGMSVMVDMGGNFTGYMTDMTRTYSIGKLTEKAYKAHQTALEIQDEIACMARPGAIAGDIYDKSLQIAEHNGLAGCFMGSNQQARFVGHGVGIEINEPPVLGARSNTMLESGMVIAVEPKFVIDGVGAVGIENTFIITETGSEKITILEERIIDLSD